MALVPFPYAHQILDRGLPTGVLIFQQETSAGVFDALGVSDAAESLITNEITTCQLNTDGDSLTIMSPTYGDPSIRFVNTGGSGAPGQVGGLYLEFASANAESTGTQPFIISGLEYDVNGDSSRDYCVIMGHGYAPNATVAAGSKWGAAGIKFEQHWNTGAGSFQSETYFILTSIRSVANGGNQEYRPVQIVHRDHDKTDGSDTVWMGLAADEIVFQNAEYTPRANWNSLGLTLAVGQRLFIASDITQFNGTTGAMSSKALNNGYTTTLTVNDNTCLRFQPTLNVTTNGQTTYAMEIAPLWTAISTNSTTLGIRGRFVTTKGTGFYHGFTDCSFGVSGAGVTVSRTFGHRVLAQIGTGASASFAYGFWAQTPSVSGTVSTLAGFKVDDHTGHYAFQGGTGKYAFGDASANTLIGFHAATPVAQQTVAAAATDPATTQALANSLRTILINLGLAKA